MDNQKSLVIVTDAWHPQKNGVVVHCEKMEELLPTQGWKVHMIYPHLFPIRMRLFFYPEIEVALFSARTMRALLKGKRPDHIHIATEGPLGLAARQYCVKRGIKFTTSYHTHYPLYVKARAPFLFRFANNYIRWFHHGAERIMVSTATLKEYLEQMGLHNVVIAPLGVDVSLFKKNIHAELPKTVAHLPRPLFIYFGRVAIEKNVEAFLKCNLPGSKIIAGGGPQLEELEKKYPDAAFLYKNGYAKDQSFIDLLSIADVFVFPSKTDTFGMVMLEALACELPVAAYDVMGAKDIVVNGVHGFIGDNLEKSAIHCLSLSRTHLRDRALEFSWEHAAKLFAQNLVEC